MNRLHSYFTGEVIYILIGFAVLVNLSGLFDTIMGPDAALYASISKTMVLKNDLPAFTMQCSASYIFYLNWKFYSPDTTLQNITAKEFLLYLSDEQANQLASKGKKIRIFKKMDSYPITLLNMKFLNSKTRSQVVAKMDIALVKQ